MKTCAKPFVYLPFIYIIELKDRLLKRPVIGWSIDEFLTCPITLHGEEPEADTFLLPDGSVYVSQIAGDPSNDLIFPNIEEWQDYESARSKVQK